MTIENAIQQADTIRPNALETEIKVYVLNRLDNRIRAKVWLCGPNDFEKYKVPVAEGQELIVAAPFDDIYVHFLCSRIDYMTENYDSYQNTQAMFETKMREYTRWFADNYKPASKRDADLVATLEADDESVTWVLPQEAFLTRVEVVIAEPFDEGVTLDLNGKTIDASKTGAFGFPEHICAETGGREFKLAKNGTSKNGQAFLMARFLPFCG